MAMRAVIGAAGLAGALAANRALVWRETKPGEAEGGGTLEPLPQGEVHVVEEGSGNGAEFVLLHGFGGSLRWFDRLAPLLAEQGRVIRLDLLGHGGSSKPRAGYAIREQAILVDAALSKLGCQRPVVIGHAMGAAVGVALAEDHPSRVAGLVVLNEGPDNSFVSSPLIARLGFIPVLGELLHRLVTDGMVREGYRDAFAEGFDLALGFLDPDQVVKDFRRMTYASYKRSWAEEDAFLAARRLDERLRDLELPMLVVFGLEDRFFNARESVAAFEAIGRVSVETLAGSGHSPVVEAPEEVARLVGSFTAALPATGTQPPRR